MTSIKKAKMEFNYDEQLPLDLSVKRNSNAVPSQLEQEKDEYIAEVGDVERYAHGIDSRGSNTLAVLDDSGIFIVPAIPPLPLSINISEKLLAIEWSLSEKLRCIRFQLPVEYVYNPIEYAFDVHAKYVRKFCQTNKKILFLGMNPGPWGMAQTGVPFGEVNAVRDWLELSGIVGKPCREQPDRKVTGFDCTRSEISGRRLWALFKELSGSAEKFFQDTFVHNYSPVAMMDGKGRNITPAELKGIEQKYLHEMCDEALADTIKLLRVEIVVGIGRFAEKRAQIVVKAAGLPTQVLSIPHPSPRSTGNGNWSEKAMQRLQELNLLRYLTK